MDILRAKGDLSSSRVIGYEIRLCASRIGSFESKHCQGSNRVFGIRYLSDLP